MKIYMQAFSLQNYFFVIPLSKHDSKKFKIYTPNVDICITGQQTDLNLKKEQNLSGLSM